MGNTRFDRHLVPVVVEVEPGAYALFVKMYNDDGTPPVVVGGDAPRDGAILTTITVR